jgi:hypothetical protein
VTDEHRKLSVFLGDWAAEGTAYGPDGGGTPWRSIHSAHWHSGEYAVVQDERAAGPFDTIALLGWDADRGTYFSWSVENHGYAREYLVTTEGDTWTFIGERERARIDFGDDGRRQTHHWEVLAEGRWVPLCDRVATRVE